MIRIVPLFTAILTSVEISSLSIAFHPHLEALGVLQNTPEYAQRKALYTVFLRENLVWFRPTLSCWETGKNLKRLMKCA